MSAHTVARSGPHGTPAAAGHSRDQLRPGLVDIGRVDCRPGRGRVVFVARLGSFHPHPTKHDANGRIDADEPTGGIEGGSPTESLKLEGTGPERADASPGESSPDQRPEVEEVLKNVSLESAAKRRGWHGRLGLVRPIAARHGSRCLVQRRQMRWERATGPPWAGVRVREADGPGSNGGMCNSPIRDRSTSTQSNSTISASNWGPSGRPHDGVRLAD